MNLGQMRKEVRRILGEPTPSLWLDDELNDYINEACKVMVSECQPAQMVWAKTLTPSGQEYDLPDDCDEVFGVGIKRSNTIFQLDRISPVQAQDGAYWTGLPSKFYVRTKSPVHAPKVSDGSLSISPISTTDSNVKKQVLGLMPVPSQADVIYIYYYQSHYTMQSDADYPAISTEFHRGIIAYAIAMAKQKEEAYAEISQVYMPQFAEFMKRFKRKAMNGGVQSGFNKAKGTGEGEYFAATDVIYIPGV